MKLLQKSTGKASARHIASQSIQCEITVLLARDSPWAIGQGYNKQQMMIDGEEKRLVQEFKATNRQLRKQLENLNNQVDKIIAFKTNRIGLKKLPAVEKSLLHSQDIRLLQVEVDNLRKRLEHLTRDSEVLKERVQIDHMGKAKQLEEELAAKQTQRQALRKETYWLERAAKALNTTDLPEQELRLYERIEQANQELIRARKVQAELVREAEQMKRYEQKKTSLITQAEANHKEKQQAAQAIVLSRVQAPVTHQPANSVSDQAWKQLKKEFLELKESKQHEETALIEENDRIRKQIRALEVRLKQKKSTIDNIRSLQIRKKERNYSTIDNHPRRQDSIRYRNRKEGYRYATKN